MERWTAIKEWRKIIVCAARGMMFRFWRWIGWSQADVDAIQSLYDSLDPKSITYAQVWEDPTTLRRALSVGAGDRVICVCSGGDNALALLLDQPECVLAVDFSSAQVAVAELKKQAIRLLDYESFLYLMGVSTAPRRDRSRVEIYDDVLRPELGTKTTAFWDVHKDALAGGLIHQGIYERYFYIFGTLVRPLLHSLETVYRFLDCAPDEQAAMYQEVFNTWAWRYLCRVYFGDVLVGRCPSFYERSDVNVGVHFLSRMEHVMCHVPVSDNYFLEYVLTGQISGRYGLPDYMKPDNFIKLKELAHKIVFMEGDILDVLEKAAPSRTSFDAIDLSNIFDFVPLSTHQRYGKAAAEIAAPGGRICHWTFVPVSEKRLDWSSFGHECEVNKGLSNELNARERAWFYQTFIVQSVNMLKSGPEKKHKNGIKKNGHTNGKTHSI